MNKTSHHDSHAKIVKKICKCPKKVQKICKRETIDSAKDVAEIVEALTELSEAASSRRKRHKIESRLKPKQHTFVPKHYKDTCVPMVPSMHTRLRYIGHCPPYPPRKTKEKAYESFDFDAMSDEEIIRSGKTVYKKRVRYYDMMPGDIILPTPAPIIKHTESDVSILNVASPKTSGEVIQAQRAFLKLKDMNPPIPGKSGHDLFKPHSGIVINQDDEFVPDAVAMPGGRISRDRRRKPCCKKGGICFDKKCTRKLCRKARQRRMKAKKHGRSRADVPYATVGGIGRGAPRPPRDADVDPCGMDDIPKPEHVTIPANLKRGTLQTHSLTVVACRKERRPVHYGILTGSFNMYDSKFSGRSRGRQALTMSVMAYCLAFHYHPKQWTMKLVDNLVDAGDQWYIQCLEKVHDHSAVQGMCEVLPFGKKQTLNLNGKKMQILLGEPDIVGYTMSLDPTVYNLCRGLKAFFQDSRAAILLTRILKVAIWKDKICYYIFDPAGRDSRAYSNYSSGASALINVKDLECVAEVLLARTALEDQKFVLAPLKVLKMLDEKDDEDIESDRELTQAEKAMMGYRILNETCAIVNANMHLGDRCFENAKYRQALPIAVMAMTYAKISPPNTWHSKTLDKILRLGSKLYVDAVHPKVMIDISIDNIPHEIIIGPYACEIIIYRERVKGQLFTTKECIFNIRTGLEDFFKHEYNSGILEFNNYTMAVWRQKEMFYIFDPYPRTKDGLRSIHPGRACVFMLLNTDAMANAIRKNFDALPATAQFHIHAFKVLKLKKREPKSKIVCTLSDEQLPGSKNKARRVLAEAQGYGDGVAKEIIRDVLPTDDFDEIKPPGKMVDEEKMGDIVSLVDSIQEEYLPPIPMRYKSMPPDAQVNRIANLDSPTVSVTQVVPPWPKPRDKSDELPEPDPEREPTPPPTPPELPPPEGAEEEEVEDEEELERRKREEEERKRAEEEARRKAEELPPPLPPPPPSPQPEPELATYSDSFEPPPPMKEDEIETLEPVNVSRKILLAADAKRRFKLRQLRKKLTEPLHEVDEDLSPEEELKKPSNFKTLPDGTQIIKGSGGITDVNAADILPFAAIMAVVTSFKYMINTWGPPIVSFVADTGKKLYAEKQDRFQLAPVHVIPKIGIGHQAYQAHIDVVTEGPTWRLEEVLSQKFLTQYDRGMLTTCNYSCAIFKKNGLYYLYDASPCNAMGLRDVKKGNACLMRFKNHHDLVTRILYNKDGQKDDQQFILSKIVVRRLLREPRLKMPDDYDYEKMQPKGKKSRPSIVKDKSKTAIDLDPRRSHALIGYQQTQGYYKIEGTTALKDRKLSKDVKACHFVSLIAMLMATMHPIRTWDHVKVDTCIEKGLEIHDKATNLNVCERRVIKNLILDGKFINVNIKKLLVVNENTEKTIEQYVKAVLRRLRFVIIRFPSCSLVLCQVDGYYHLFDPYESPNEPVPKGESVTKLDQPPPGGENIQRSDSSLHKGAKKGSTGVASWTLYPSIDSVINRIKKTVGSEANNPEFYTFELTSVKSAPRHSAMYYRLSPLFRPDENPNAPYMRLRRERPAVDEKMYWLNIEYVPWSRMLPTNDLGFDRKTPKSVWKDWDIEFPGDLYSLWGAVHPLDPRFSESSRGQQYLCVSVCALAMAQAAPLSAWTPSMLDGIVDAGDRYFSKCLLKIGSQKNVELTPETLETKFDDMYPYAFNVKFEKIIFGFVYNIYPDRFNLSKSMSYFFEKSNVGVLISPKKNLAFGKRDGSYYMFDCQSYGAPIFAPGQGSAYMLKCESLNRLIYCMTVTLNLRRHGQQFHLYSVAINLSEKK